MDFIGKKKSRPNAVLGLETYTAPSAAQEIVEKLKKGLRPSAPFGLEKRENWRPNGAFGPSGFSKNQSTHAGSVKTDLLIMVYKKISKRQADSVN